MKAPAPAAGWLAACLAAAAGLLALCYLLLPIPPGLSLRWLLVLGCLLLAITGGLWLQMRWFARPTWQGLAARQKAAWVLSAAALSALLFAFAGPNITQVLEKFPALAPVEQLVVRPAAGVPGGVIDIWKVKIGPNRLDTTDLSLQGSWQAAKNHLRTGDPSASLTVTGRVPREISISFWRSPAAGQVEAAWDGQHQVIDLRGEVEEEALLHFRFDSAKRQEPPLALLLRLLALPGWAALAFLSIGVFFFRQA